MKRLLKKHVKILNEHGITHYTENKVWYIKKALSFCFFGTLAVFMVPVYLIIRVIRPLMLIRFGKLSSTRIGHLAQDTGIYICQRDHGIQPRNSLDIFYYSKPVSNRQLLKMWKRVLHINRIARCFSMLNSIFPGGDKHEITLVERINKKYQYEESIISKSRVLLSFTFEEIAEAKAGLLEMGIEENASFVCLFVRDSAYLDKQFPHGNWYYQNYRDCNIQDYRLAADELADRGYYVIRMGAAVKEAINTNNPKVIDYACNGSRTDLLDIYLSANCKFFISGGGAGLDSVPALFGRPILYIDYDKLFGINTWSAKAITTIKRLWLKDEKRFMKFIEMLDSGIAWDGNSRVYDEYKIEVVDSKPEGIRDAVIEMIERLLGTWNTTEEDEDLQRRFRTLFRRSFPKRDFNARIGKEFLRQTGEPSKKELLETIMANKEK